MEADEIGEFTKEMQEAGEASMTHVSLIIAVLAVLVAMVTVMGHRTHTEAVLMQSRAADQWNEYQARKMRSQQVTIASDMLGLLPTANADGVQAKLHDYKASLAKWKAETDEDADKAKDFETEVKLSEAKASRYDLGEALLQIAVVLASITLLTRHRRYVVTGVVLGLGGLLIAGSALLVR